VEVVGTTGAGAVMGCGGSRRYRARRITPTRRITNATMERYQPMPGPHVVVIVMPEIVVEFDPKNEDQGPLPKWPGESFAAAPGSDTAKSPGAAMARTRARAASAMTGAARRGLRRETTPRIAAMMPRANPPMTMKNPASARLPVLFRFWVEYDVWVGHEGRPLQTGWIVPLVDGMPR